LGVAQVNDKGNRQ